MGRSLFYGHSQRPFQFFGLLFRLSLFLLIVGKPLKQLHPRCFPSMAKVARCSQACRSRGMEFAFAHETTNSTRGPPCKNKCKCSATKTNSPYLNNGQCSFPDLASCQRHCHRREARIASYWNDKIQVAGKQRCGCMCDPHRATSRVVICDKKDDNSAARWLCLATCQQLMEDHDCRTDPTCGAFHVSVNHLCPASCCARSAKQASEAI